MKEIIILSGKGGTGKTSVTAALVALASQSGSLVLADADVDAADLSLVTNPIILESREFKSGVEARIRTESCLGCDRCRQFCRFDAIERDPITKRYKVRDSGCEGCGVCAWICPARAIDLLPRHCGIAHTSETRFGKFFHARLDPGGENSGKLVSLVRKEARACAEREQADWLFVDGPPGIGCPAIAAITGADLVIAVTEPGISASHDLSRLFHLTRHFALPTCLIINKADINPELAKAIEEEARQAGVVILGSLPWSKEIIAAQLNGTTVPEYSKNSDLLVALKTIWESLCQNMKQISTITPTERVAQLNLNPTMKN